MGSLCTTCLNLRGHFLVDYSHFSFLYFGVRHGSVRSRGRRRRRRNREWHPWRQDQITYSTWETIFIWVLIKLLSTTARSLTFRRRISSNETVSSIALTSLSVAIRFCLLSQAFDWISNSFWSFVIYFFFFKFRLRSLSSVRSTKQQLRLCRLWSSLLCIYRVLKTR